MRRFILIAAALCAAACDESIPATAVTIEVRADDGVRQRMQALNLQVRSFEGDVVDCADPECWPLKLDGPVLALEDIPEWPVRVPVVPRGNDASRVFEVVVDAMVDGEVLVRQRAVAGFTTDKNRTLVLRLQDVCAGEDGVDICGADDCFGVACEVCRAGVCEEVGEPEDLFEPTCDGGDARTVACGSDGDGEVEQACEDGRWVAVSTCVLPEPPAAAPADCDALAHGQRDERLRYELSQVPFGDTCVSETQTQTCDDGTLLAWTGDYGAEACEVLPPGSCSDAEAGEVDHEVTLTRIRHAAATVPFGGSCESEVQTRTCVDGDWGAAWTGSYVETACVAEGPLPCAGAGGDIAHGQYEMRTRYQAASVPFGESCVSEVQRRLCGDGSLAPWDGALVEEACAVEPNCAPLHPSAVAWWAVDGDALDEIGDHPATAVGGPVNYVDGVVGQAAEFGPGDALSVAYVDALNPAASFTLEGWVATTQVTGHIASSACRVPCDGQSMISIGPVDGKLAIRVRDDDPGYSEDLLVGDSVMNDGGFHHVAHVRDMQTGRLLVYLDGQLDGQQPITTEVGALHFAGNPFIIGGWPLPDGTPAGDFEGRLDELTYYDSALSPVDIAAIHAAGSAGKCDPVPPGDQDGDGCFNDPALVVDTDYGLGADTYLEIGLADGRGARGGIHVKRNGGGKSRKMMVRFDLSGATLVAGAALDLFFFSNNDVPANPSHFDVYGLLDQHPGELWDEYGTVWADAPGHDPAIDNGVLPAETVPLGTIAVPVPEAELGDAFSLQSAALDDFLAADTNGVVTLIITRQESNFSVQSFGARESTVLSAPQLRFGVSLEEARCSPDRCPLGERNWTSDPTSDLDGDGCHDTLEDDDDDGDGVPDAMDRCPRGYADWVSEPGNDMDGDGCHDSEDPCPDDAGCPEPLPAPLPPDAVTCAAIKAEEPASTDGMYMLDLDGAGPDAPFAAYCDMTTDGGGWLLMMRINALQCTQYDAGDILETRASFGQVDDDNYLPPHFYTMPITESYLVDETNGVPVMSADGLGGGTADAYVEAAANDFTNTALWYPQEGARSMFIIRGTQTSDAVFADGDVRFEFSLNSDEVPTLGFPVTTPYNPTERRLVLDSAFGYAGGRIYEAPLYHVADVAIDERYSLFVR